MQFMKMRKGKLHTFESGKMFALYNKTGKNTGKMMNEYEWMYENARFYLLFIYFIHIS